MKPGAWKITTARDGQSGYFDRWICEVGHKHRTEQAATECSLRLRRKIEAAR